MTKGGRNLILLGVISVVVAATTTGVSLALYHNSGDIYLDRSRPGFLPDKEEIEEDEKTPSSDYKFPDTGTITNTDKAKYLQNLEVEIRAIDEFANPFSPDALSDETLGLPTGS